MPKSVYAGPAALEPGRLFATAPEAGEVLHADARTVRRGIEDGTIPAVKVGGNWRVPVAWLREQAGLPAA